jgi:hypothetical protein
MLIVRPKLSRGRAAIGVIVGAALIQALGLVRGLPERTVALMGITAALSFAVSTLVLRRHYARYFEAQEEHGVRSVESRKASNPVAFGIIGLIAVFAAIFLVVFKGVTSRSWVKSGHRPGRASGAPDISPVRLQNSAWNRGLARARPDRGSTAA